MTADTSLIFPAGEKRHSIPAYSPQHKMFGGADASPSVPRKDAARDRRGADVSDLDPEQEKKYEELIEMLLVGGYFRARINGLSRFDKVCTLFVIGNCYFYLMATV